MDNYSFRKKRVLITGASGGLGSALARTLAEEGAHLVASSRSEKALKASVDAMPDAPKGCMICHYLYDI